MHIRDNLTVLCNLAQNSLINSIFDVSEASPQVPGQIYNHFLSEVYSACAEDNLLSVIEQLIMLDENAFSLTCASGKMPTAYLAEAFKKDVKTIISCVKNLPAYGGYSLGSGIDMFEENLTRIDAYLAEIYSERGYGKFILGKAFKFENGEITQLLCTDSIKLDSLKDYQDEKRAIIDNIGDFLNGLPFAHMLLYGDRGTGKSSTIHAVLNEMYDKGLRLIELNRMHLTEIDKIKQQVALLPLKFIIYIDDLSLSGDDENASALKAAVEGSISAGDNCMIVATSNRRHIIKENFSDRSNSVHASDCIEEQLSLSDRFGLTVMFSTTGKESYLSIVKQLASDFKLKTPTTKLEDLAERWAIIKGGRSPRRAKQFVDFVYSCEQSNRPVLF